MDFRIADTFSDSLARLTDEEQKAAKTTAFDLQLNPANPGMSFHKLDGAKDKNFWSVRVSRDVRLIVHRTPESFLLCYVDHHDKAYAWAERRKLEVHPKTGAAQWVEIRERVQEIVIPAYVAAMNRPQPIFTGVRDDEFLEYGVPQEWLNDVKQATEESLLSVADHLPREAAEALLELATGGKPRKPAPEPVKNAFEHPDAQRRFRIMSNVEELQRALEFPWDKWTVFLHPDQRQLVEKSYAGPARVSGSAGTGKTIVALHRAVYLARKHPDARVVLTTFSDTLAEALRVKLRRLVSNEPALAERLEVQAIDALGQRLYQALCGPLKLPAPQRVEALLEEASKAAGPHKFPRRFLRTEWAQVVDAWQLQTWDEYRDVARLGRKTRLSDAQRKLLWSIFEKVVQRLSSEGVLTQAGLFNRLSQALQAREKPPFDFAVIDEAQDLGIPQLRFLAALGRHRKDALFFAGDLGQRIFQQPFSWKAVGVDIRGRSRTLRVNYRTSHQIRAQADRLLDAQSADADGNVDERRDTVSVFNGPPPEVQTCASVAKERDLVASWLAKRVAEGLAAHELAVFVRSEAELPRARAAVEKAGLPVKELDSETGGGGFVSISTMHLAKGLEFRGVVVMACDDQVIPSQERIAAIGDEADLEEVYVTERHLLYVACTRARDQLLVTGVEPASEFLDDFGGGK